MIELILSTKKYSENFVKNKVPKVLKNIMLSDCANHPRMNMERYLIDNYSLKLQELILAVCSNIIVSKIGSDYILSLDSKSRNGSTSLDSLTRLVDYGNREVRGCNLFDNSIHYLKSRINSIYYYSLVKGKSNLWQ